MFINARPRIVSHGFETFVPYQRVESLHQRLVEMTNNDVNAWKFFRPVATPSNGWDQNLDDFANNENCPVCYDRSKDLRRSMLIKYSFMVYILDTTRT